MDLQSVLISCQFTTGILVVHEAVYIILDDSPGSD